LFGLDRLLHIERSQYRGDAEGVGKVWPLKESHGGSGGRQVRHALEQKCDGLSCWRGKPYAFRKFDGIAPDAELAADGIPDHVQVLIADSETSKYYDAATHLDTICGAWR